MPKANSQALTAIIVAAGSGTRMGFDKMLAALDGRPVVGHTIAAFQRCPAVGEIVLIAHPDREADIARVADEGGYEKVARIVPGGATRRDSVAHGLATIAGETGYVAVHDGARPWITPAQIERVFAAAQQHGAAASARPITDTVKRADTTGRVAGAVDREGLWAMETPQIFRTALLKRAYSAALAGGAEVTDEVSAIELLGEPVQLVQNDSPNPKVTFPADLEGSAP